MALHRARQADATRGALAYVKYSSASRQIKEDVRTNQRGLWQGGFIAPWDWRHHNNKMVILGAYRVPIDAQPMLLGPSATEGALSPECTIKGIISRNGERIYHMQHQSSYARIKMDKGGGRRWFVNRALVPQLDGHGVKLLVC